MLAERATSSENLIRKVELKREPTPLELLLQEAGQKYARSYGSRKLDYPTLCSIIFKTGLEQGTLGLNSEFGLYKKRPENIHVFDTPKGVVKLSNQDAKLLSTLMAAKGFPLTASAIGEVLDLGPEVIKVYIHHLRQKVDIKGQQGWENIKNDHNVGYYIASPVQATEPQS